MTKHEGREERSRRDAGWIIYLEHRCIPQLEIKGLSAVSVSRREARQALCGWTAMLHELEDQVAAFFEFDVTIGSCVADALCVAWKEAGGVGVCPNDSDSPCTSDLRQIKGMVDHLRELS